MGKVHNYMKRYSTCSIGQKVIPVKYEAPQPQQPCMKCHIWSIAISQNKKYCAACGSMKMAPSGEPGPGQSEQCTWCTFWIGDQTKGTNEMSHMVHRNFPKQKILCSMWFYENGPIRRAGTWSIWTVHMMYFLDWWSNWGDKSCIWIMYVDLDYGLNDSWCYQVHYLLFMLSYTTKATKWFRIASKVHGLEVDQNWFRSYFLWKFSISKLFW